MLPPTWWRNRRGHRNGGADAAPAGRRGCCWEEMLRESRKDASGPVEGTLHRLFARRGFTLSVSVVIPCYNQGRFLQEAIASATAQGELVPEIVVVDDGSTDETHAVATRDGTVRYLRQERSGLSEARNSGWRASSGDYVIFLDADDRLLPGAVEAGLEAFGRWPARRLCLRTLRTHRRARRRPANVEGAAESADDRTFTTGDFELVLPDGRRAGRSPQPRG